MHLTIDCLIYTPEGIKAFYNANILVEQENQSKQSKKAEGDNPLAFSFFGVNQTFRRLLAGSNLGVKSASDFKIGAPGRIRTADQLVRSQLLYPTELRIRTKELSSLSPQTGQITNLNATIFTG